MTLEYSERVIVDGIEYRFDAKPLAPAFELFKLPTLAPIWPVSSRGYVGHWEIHDDNLLLADVWTPGGSAPRTLFPNADGKVLATWYSGFFRGRGSERRFTGAPTREFYNDEIFVEILNGLVNRFWKVDLRQVPDQTDDEIKLTLPDFLWPERLR